MKSEEEIKEIKRSLEIEHERICIFRKDKKYFGLLYGIMINELREKIKILDLILK